MEAKMLTKWVLLGVLSVLLSSCALLPCGSVSSGSGNGTTTSPVVVQPPPPPPPPPPAPVPEPVDEEPDEPPPFVAGTNNAGDDILIATDAEGNPVKSTFNFDFDNAELSSGDFASLQQIAKRLVENRNRTVTISGHCDERGTREYNLALGERRAKAVADFLMSAGVRDSQITTTSFGEEVPLDTASTEAAWAKNRRAVIDIR